MSGQLEVPSTAEQKTSGIVQQCMSIISELSSLVTPLQCVLGIKKDERSEGQVDQTALVIKTHLTPRSSAICEPAFELITTATERDKNLIVRHMLQTELLFSKLPAFANYISLQTSKRNKMTTNSDGDEKDLLQSIVDLETEMTITATGSSAKLHYLVSLKIKTSYQSNNAAAVTTVKLTFSRTVAHCDDKSVNAANSQANNNAQTTRDILPVDRAIKCNICDIAGSDREKGELPMDYSEATASH